MYLDGRENFVSKISLGYLFFKANVKARVGPEVEEASNGPSQCLFKNNFVDFFAF